MRRSRFLKRRDPRTGLVTQRVADADCWLTESVCVRGGLRYDRTRPERLIVVVTPLSRQPEPDSRRPVGGYLARWAIQENSFRALEAFVPLDLNFGVNRKQRVPNRPGLARLAELTPHLPAVESKIESQLRQRAEQPQLIARQIARQAQTIETWLKHQARGSATGQTGRVARRPAQMTNYRARPHQRLTRYLAHQRDLEGHIEDHQPDRTRVLHPLADLDRQAPFFEVDPETDHLITPLRIAVYNRT